MRKFLCRALAVVIMLTAAFITIVHSAEAKNACTYDEVLHFVGGNLFSPMQEDVFADYHWSCEDFWFKDSNGPSDQKNDCWELFTKYECSGSPCTILERVEHSGITRDALIIFQARRVTFMAHGYNFSCSAASGKFPIWDPYKTGTPYGYSFRQDFDLWYVNDFCTMTRTDGLSLVDPGSHYSGTWEKHIKDTENVNGCYQSGAEG